MTALPTLPNQPAVGDLPTATWADEVSQWFTFLSTIPVFEGYQTSAQSIANAAGFATAVLLDTSQIDTASGHSVVTNTSRYTAVYPGLYRVHGGVSFAANATGSRSAGISYNGTNIAQSRTDSAGSASSGATLITEALVQMAAGDYVEIRCGQTSGAALALNTLQSRMIVEWKRS